MAWNARKMNFADRQADIEVEEQGQPVQRVALADTPEGLNLLFRLRDQRVADHAVLQGSPEKRFEPFAFRFMALQVLFHDDCESGSGFEEPEPFGHTIETEIALPHCLICGEAGEFLLCPLEQGDDILIAVERAERRQPPGR